MSAITICKGATISSAEVKRVEEAMKNLVDDGGANHKMSVEVVLHNHHEYPKAVYRGKEVRTVDGPDSEAAAAKDGFGPYDHEEFSK